MPIDIMLKTKLPVAARCRQHINDRPLVLPQKDTDLIQSTAVFDVKMISWQNNAILEFNTKKTISK